MREVDKGWTYYAQASGVLMIGLCCTFFSIAGIPEAPDIEGAANGDYLKVANQLSIMMIGYLVPLMYAVSGFTYCGGMLYMFNRAKEREEWGGFFKTAVIGMGLMMMILYFLNAIKKTVL